MMQKNFSNQHGKQSSKHKKAKRKKTTKTVKREQRYNRRLAVNRRIRQGTKETQKYKYLSVQLMSVEGLLIADGF